jgi:hypothetical protein
MPGSQSEFERLVFEIASSTSTADLRALRDYVREAFAGDAHLRDLDERITHRAQLVASAEGLIDDVRHPRPDD